MGNQDDGLRRRTNDESSSSYSYLSPLGDLLEERVYDTDAVTRQGNLDVYNSGLADGNSDNGAKKEIGLCHVYTLLPFTNGDKETWNNVGTMESMFALALAAQHLNTGNSSIIEELDGLPDRCPIRFSMELADTELAESVAVNSVVDVLSRNYATTTAMPNPESNSTLSNSNGNIPVRPCFFLGAARSAVSVPTSIFTGLQGYPQLSPISTSTALNDKNQHPLFGRTIPADDGTAVPFIIYLRDTLKVKHLGVIHINDAYGSAFGQGLQAAAQTLAPDMSVQAVEIPIDATPENIQYAVQILQQTKFAYFFGILFPTKLVDAVMEEAYRQGIQGTGNHQWYFSDSVGDEIVSRSFPADSVLAKSYLGTGIISASGGSPQFNPQLQKLTDALHWIRGNRADLDFIMSIVPTHWDYPQFEPYDVYGQPDFMNTPGLIGPFVYDAMIAAGLAACQVHTHNAFDNNNRPPDLSGSDHFQAILEQNFAGTSGTLQLDAESGTRRASSAFFQIQNHALDLDRTTASETQFKPVLSNVFQDGGWVELEAYVFNDGTTNPPPGVIAVKADQNHFTAGVRTGGLSMCCVAMAMAVGLMVWTKYHEKHNVVRASQPIFLYLIGIGAIVFCSAIVPLSLDDGVVSVQGCDIACQTIPWLMSIGFTLIFSALFTKTYRINQIIGGAKKFKRIKLTVWQVAQPMLVLLGLNVIVLVLSTVLSPLHWEFEVERRDSFGQPLESYGYCSTEDALPYLITLGALNLGALLVAIYQAYQARNISIQYAESQYIFNAAVSILLICCFGVPILLLAEKGDAYFFVFSAILFCTSCSILFFIFVPKIQFVREEDRPAPEHSSMDFMTSALSNATHGPMVSGLGFSTQTMESHQDTSHLEHAGQVVAPLPSIISEHTEDDDDEDDEDDDGEGVKILTGKTQEELLRDIKILKSKLKLAWDGGRGMLRMNVPLPSEELINLRVSGLSGGHGVRGSATNSGVGFHGLRGSDRNSGVGFHALRGSERSAGIGAYYGARGSDSSGIGSYGSRSSDSSGMGFDRVSGTQPLAAVPENVSADVEPLPRTDVEPPPRTRPSLMREKSVFERDTIGQEEINDENL